MRVPCILFLVFLAINGSPLLETRSNALLGSEVQVGSSVLFKTNILVLFFMVHSDNYVGFMWIRIDRGTSLYRDNYISVCYFPPTSSYYAVHSIEGGDPYEDLLEHIARFSSMGDIIILGDFNTQTRDLQPPLHGQRSKPMCMVVSDPHSFGLLQLSEDC